MYLYELALEMGVRSPDLVERAAGLGMAGLGPSTQLSAAQVAALRAGVPAPPPPAAGPPVGPSPATPGAISWPGSPTPPPPAAPGPPPAGSPGPGWVPPPPPVASGPPPAGSPGPGWVPPPPPPGIGSIPPPPGAPPWPPGPGGPPGLVPGQGPGSGRAGLRVGFAVVLTVVVVGVLGFFFLGTTTDRDERRRELEATNAEVEARTAAEAADEAERADVERRFAELAEERGTTTTAVTAAGEGVVDRDRFCRAAMDITRFELSLAASGIDADWDAVRRDVADGHERWRSGADGLVASTAGDLQTSVEFYRSTYRSLIDDVLAAESNAAVAAVFAELPFTDLQLAASDINRATLDTCA